MRSIYILVLWLVSALAAMDFPAEFVHNPGGSLALSGLPGYKSTPARLPESGFGVTYAQVPEAALQGAGAGGEFGFGERYRIAFFSSYLMMDSLYRRVYSELDFSVAWLSKENFGVIGGMGYGVSADWLPGEESWSTNRYKLAGTLVKSPLSLAVLGNLVNHRSYCKWDYSLALRFEGMRLGAFVEYDGVSVDVGNFVKFSHLSVISSYRFPEFAVAVSLVFTVGGWSFSGSYGNAYPIWDWFGFTASKTIRKKTIL